MEEKELLQKQKDDFKKDIKNFKEQIIDKIAHTENDAFNSLYVFGNFYKLAIESTPELKQKFEEFDAANTEQEKEIAELTEIVNKSTQEALQAHNIRFDIERRSHYRDSDAYRAKIYIDDKLIYQESAWDTCPSVREFLENLLNYKENVNEDIMNEYLDLKEELNKDKGIFKQARNKIIQSKIDKLAKGNNRLRQYLEIEPYLSKIKAAYEKVLENNTIEEQIKSIKDNNSTERDALKKLLRQKSTTVLALKYVSLYNKNFEYLRMHPDGAKLALKNILFKGTEYYAKGSLERIDNNLDEWLKISEVASTFHERWREGRKNQDGTFEPRWKAVKDASFISNVKEMKELPSNVRIVDGKVEQDIANTDFDNLCLDYQIENFEAAQVAYEVAKQDYTKAEAGKVGKIIHDEWLKRNPWAKDSELDVEFLDLVKSEKVKDLIHYEIAKEIRDGKEITIK